MNMYKGPMDKAKGGLDWEWEVEVGKAGQSGGGKMETTVFEHNEKYQKINYILLIMLKSEQRLKNLWDNFKLSNIQIIGVPRWEEEKQEIENFLKKKKRRKNSPIWQRK